MIERLVARYIKYRFEQGGVKSSNIDAVSGVYDQAYQDDGNRYHQLDIYYPDMKTIEPLPMLFYVHGGAWVAFDKNYNRSYCEYLASFGYCVVNASYRLLPNTDMKGQLQDLAAALRFAKSLKLPQMSQDEVIFMGDSAGAHLASVLYCIVQEKSYQDIFQIYFNELQIKALVLQNMVSDLSVFLNNPRYKKILTPLLFGKAREHSSYYGKASFLQLATSQFNHVPVFLVSSEQDSLHPQSIKMKAYLDQYHWEYETMFWKSTDRKGLGHVFQVTHREWEESIQTHGAIFRFLAKVLNDNAFTALET